MKKILLIALISILNLTSSHFILFAINNEINIILNGKTVEFTFDSGYPFVDENNRTLVPLRATMEAAGFVVGYDANKKAAIVVTDRGRLEVPIGSRSIYFNNKLLENDTNAVIHNGRTYLPIRIILEQAGFTVEWDGKTRSVNSYTFDPDFDQLVPYSTSDLSLLARNLINGNVIYLFV